MLIHERWRCKLDGCSGMKHEHTIDGFDGITAMIDFACSSIEAYDHGFCIGRASKDGLKWYGELIWTAIELLVATSYLCRRPQCIVDVKEV
jgi:hypothetical protein